MIDKALGRGLAVDSVEFMSIEQHVEGLQSEQERVRSELALAKERVRGLELEHERLAAAVAALTGKHGSARSTRARGVTKAEVVAEIESVRRSGEEQRPEAELKAEVEKRLRSRGRPLTGFALRFRQALQKASE